MNDEGSKAQDGLLPDELEPPPGAGDRIAGALAARGLIRRTSASGSARRWRSGRGLPRRGFSSGGS